MLDAKFELEFLVKRNKKALGLKIDFLVISSSILVISIV
jgi:hypothetical protein